MTGPAHGFDDEPTRLLLRSRPPRAALDWAGRQVGGTVTAVRPVLDDRSSTVHVLRVVAASGARRQVILRRYVRPELQAEDPDIAERERGRCGS